MNRRSFMKFLGFAPAVVVASSATEVLPAQAPSLVAKLQEANDRAEYYQAAREAEAKTLDMLLELKGGIPTRILGDASLSPDE